MSRRIQWCPSCKERSLHEDGGRFENENMFTWVAKRFGTPTGGLERYAFLNSLFQDLLPEFPSIGGYFRYRKCSACDAVWTSIETPDLFFDLIIQELEKIVNERKALAAELEIARQKNETIRDLLGRLNGVFQADRRDSRFVDIKELE